MPLAEIIKSEVGGDKGFDAVELKAGDVSEGLAAIGLVAVGDASVGLNVSGLEGLKLRSGEAVVD